MVAPPSNSPRWTTRGEDGFCAELFGDGVDQVVEGGVDDGGEVGADLDGGGLHTPEGDVGGEGAAEAADGEDLLEAHLVKGGLESQGDRDIFFLETNHAPGRSVGPDGVQDEDALGVLEIGEQLEAHDAAVDGTDLRRQVVALLEALHGPHAQAFVLHQDVADPEDQDVRFRVSFHRQCLLSILAAHSRVSVGSISFGLDRQIRLISGDLTIS
jgi:hypothetical protein